MGGKALAQALGALRVYSDRAYRYREDNKIINWGSSRVPNWSYPEQAMLNSPAAVGRASNKLATFQSFTEHGVACPLWTTELAIAADWFYNPQQYGLLGPVERVYCRQKLMSKGGDGIVIATLPEELVPAPLYTAGIDVAAEYRVHIVNGNIIDVQQKRRMSTQRLTEEGVVLNDLVRNHANGWVFCRGDVHLPTSLGDEAQKAVRALGLDFGAVDCVVDHALAPYILEVNTAPGLEGTTLERYTEAFRQLIV